MSRGIVVTGGAGFIGSFVVDALLRAFPDRRIVVLDKLTYAARREYLAPALRTGRAELRVGDIADPAAVRAALEDAEFVVHAAAETHVDRAFADPLGFTRTNVLGTQTVIEACRDARVRLLVHVSSDEVYGEVPSGAAAEDAPMAPTNPYAASKAAAEVYVAAAVRAHRLPAIVVRPNNAFGARQFPEKIIPRFCMRLNSGQPLHLHGDGRHVRNYLAVEDLAEAIALLVRRGAPGAAYNVGTTEEYSNLEVARMVCDAFGTDAARVVRFVPDRPYNDRRYAVRADRIAALGWRPRQTLAGRIPQIAAWYAANLHLYAADSIAIAAVGDGGASPTQRSRARR